MWLLAAYPFALFYSAAFSEGLFLLRRIESIDRVGLRAYVARDPIDLWNVAAVAFTMAMSVVAWRRFGVAYAVSPAAYFGPALLVDGPSLGRYSAVLFPSFLAASTLLSIARPSWRPC